MSAIIDETTIKARIAGNRTTASFTLIGALLSVHYAYALNGWHAMAFGALTSALATITINRTVRAATYAAALLTSTVVDGLKKAGKL